MKTILAFHQWGFSSGWEDRIPVPVRVCGQSLELMRRRMVLYLESQFSRLKQYQPPSRKSNHRRLPLDSFK